MTVELALTPDNRWDIDVAGLVEATSRAGFTALGILGDRIDATTPATYADAGLRCHEVLALVVSDDASATLAAAEKLGDAARTMNAPWVLTVFAAPLTVSTAKVVADCASVLTDAGTGMAVESSPLGSVATMRDGVDIVRAAGDARAGLLIDSWHFSFGNSTWEDLAQVPLDLIAYVQFADALAPVSDSLGRETMHRRAVPGEGVLELDRFAATLLDRGWSGVVSVEVLSSDLREQPVVDVVRRLHDASVRYWQ